ncbi:MAG: hypothetical protein WCE45_01605 [Sedimentisphaerales bacterium]
MKIQRAQGMQGRLEKIVNSAKQVGRTSWKFIKNNAKIGIMLAGLYGGVYFMNQTTQQADAGAINIKNWSTSSGIYKTEFNARNVAGATEGYDGYPLDSLFLDGPSQPELQIYSKIDDQRFSTDSHPTTTFGWNFDLAVKGTVTDVNNYFRYKVIDTNDLFGKTLTMYDKANPGVQYELLMDGAYHNIGLPNLTHGTGEYAHWRLEIEPNIPGDLNINGKVNFEDYSILAENFSRTDCNSNNGWCSYSDIDKNGTVDYNDLSEFSNNWLWDVNDPNTW